jgi:hypothetical protein
VSSCERNPATESSTGTPLCERHCSLLVDARRHEAAHGSTAQIVDHPTRHPCLSTSLGPLLVELPKLTALRARTEPHWTGGVTCG